MKQKDIVYLLLAVGIFLVAGYVGYTQLVPKKASSKTVEVEKVGAISETMDSMGMTQLTDSSKTTDFGSPVDLDGLGNKAPFGQ